MNTGPSMRYSPVNPWAPAALPSSNSSYNLRAAEPDVLYRSRMNPILKKNFAVFTVLDWIATLTAHIPDKREQLVRYYAITAMCPGGKEKKSPKRQPRFVRSTRRHCPGN